MRKTTLARLGLVLLLALLSTACATSRGEMALGVPAAKQGIATPDGDRVAVIEWVRDQRVFETDPRDPSIPSLKKGGEYALDAEGRKRAIARKRNGYGMALGDILLEGGETVESLTRDLVTTGLHERGIRVLEPGADAPEDALRLRVGIKEFWAWFSPGFWSVSMEAKLRMDFEVVDSAGQRQFTVSAYGINKGQSGREANWRVAYDRAFEDYLAKQRDAFQRKGL